MSGSNSGTRNDQRFSSTKTAVRMSIPVVSGIASVKVGVAGSMVYDSITKSVFISDGLTWGGAGISAVEINVDSIQEFTPGAGVTIEIVNFMGNVLSTPGDIKLAPTGDIDACVNKVINVVDPTADQDAATKKYVDDNLESIDWKNSVRAATVAAGTLATDFEDGDTIDGVLLVTGDRILIKDQASGVENGIYIVEAAGAPTRAVDLDTGASAASIAMISDEGTVNADKAFICTNDLGTDVVGTDALVFVRLDTTIDHGLLLGLADDDHLQYALLAGRAGGQLLQGGTAAGEDLTLESTSNAGKGTVISLDPLEVDDIDALTASTLLVGKSTATKVEIADTGVVTEVQGDCNIEGVLDTIAAGTLTVGPATATKVEIADTGIVTEVQGSFDVFEASTLNGSLIVVGTTNLNDDVTIGNALADSLTVTSRLAATGINGLTATSFVTIIFDADPESIAAGVGGAISIVVYYTDISTDAGGDAFALANGTMVGQLKLIRLLNDGGGDAVITPTNLEGFATITMNDVGDEVELMWNGSAWRLIKNLGAVVA